MQRVAHYEKTLLEYVQFKITKLRSRGIAPKYIVLNVDDWKQLAAQLNRLAAMFPSDAEDNRLFGLPVYLTTDKHDPIVGV